MKNGPLPLSPGNVSKLNTRLVRLTFDASSLNWGHPKQFQEVIFVKFCTYVVINLLESNFLDTSPGDCALTQ